MFRDEEDVLPHGDACAGLKMPKQHLAFPMPVSHNSWQCFVLESFPILLGNIIEHHGCSYLFVPIQPDNCLSGSVDKEDFAFGQSDADKIGRGLELWRGK